MKDIITKSISLGLGIGVAGKQQIEKIASEIQKQAKISKKDSQKLVKDMIQKGEKVRANFDKEVSKLVKDAAKSIDSVTPVFKKEFEDLKKKVEGKKAPNKTSKKKTTKKKTAKKTTKKAKKAKK